MWEWERDGGKKKDRRSEVDGWWRLEGSRRCAKYSWEWRWTKLPLARFLLYFFFFLLFFSSSFKMYPQVSVRAEVSHSEATIGFHVSVWRLSSSPLSSMTTGGEVENPQGRQNRKKCSLNYKYLIDNEIIKQISADICQQLCSGGRFSSWSLGQCQGDRRVCLTDCVMELTAAMWF